MKLKELTTYLSQGREIEFDYNNHKYFLQPDYENFGSNYILFDCTTPEADIVFQWTINAILAFPIDGKHSLKQDTSIFNFTCIL